SVYNQDGDKIGEVEDIVLDKLSNNIEFAVLGFGGILGMGEKFHPIPWNLLDYNEDVGGYVVSMDEKILKKAPAYRMEDLTKNDADVRSETYSYYNVPQYWS